MKTFLIIDGSSVFYRAFYALPSLTAPSGEPTGAVVGFANIILKILREQSPDLAAVALDTAKKTFRNELFHEYKATRQEMPDDLAAQLPLLKKFIEVIGLKSCAAAGYEADDIIGTLATQACKNFSVKILTGDRDALQLINAATKVLLNKNSAVEIYDEKKFFDEYGFAPAKLVDFKALRGDTSDNIPGVKGIGDKTAATLIKDFGSLENILARREEIKSKKIRTALENFSDDAIMSKRLAQIVCNVPEIFFNAEDFKIVPDFSGVEDFCNRYALNRLKKKIHDIFGLENLFSNARENFLQVPEVQPLDFEKIFAAESLTVAQLENRFAIKISGGEIFSATRENLQRVFDEFNGKIILSGTKDYLKSFLIPNSSFLIIFDVELAAYLLYPEMESYTCEKLLPKEFDGLQMPDQSPAANATALEKLADLYEKKLAAADMTRLYSEIELPLTEVLACMEERGVVVDKGRLEKKSAEMSERIDALTKNIYTLAGKMFNINSSQQLADVLFVKLKLPPIKKTKTGYSTNAEVLEEIKWRHPIVEKILKYRALTKLKSTYLDGLGKLIGDDGRIHTNFNQMVTATGRLSSSDPNLQNIPIRSEEGREIRALFEPGANYDCILSADYSQIELRLLAHMSGDENLIDAFVKGQDIHARTAAEVFGVPLEKITPDLRRKAKAVNFGIVYGISDYGLSQNLNINRKEAGEYIAKYFERYPGVKNFLDETVALAHKFGYVTTMFGRRRALPAINSRNFNLRSLAERMAMNTPIQGTAADIIKLAMIRAEKNLRGFRSRIIIQVHDELVLEAVETELADVEKILREAMENVVKLSVPLSVDVHSGKNWSLAK
ncbi:MAG: DNA polymerase I [Selenomonadaceae bacterium]|nr:DNA polymerase I [Selenomonadaceae bacterium]